MITDIFWTPSYRFRLRMRRKLRGRDGIGLILLAIAIALSIQAKDPATARWLTGCYVILAAAWAWVTMRARESRHAVQGLVVGGLFHLTNKELFARSNRTRFTLLRRAPFRPNYIIPWFRFRRGGKGPVQEADESRARYRRGEGVTGQAWDAPAGELRIQLIPPFGGNRSLMEALYMQEFGVAEDTAQSISDYMVGVRAIVSYAFHDNRDQFVGMLSLDVSNADVNVPDGGVVGGRKRLVIKQDDDEPIIVDADKLYLLLRAVGNVLESFQMEERSVSYE